MAQWRLGALNDRKVAWLSLDEGDNEPVRFWSYVIAALRSVVPEFGEGPLSLLRTPGVDLMGEAVPALINELLETPSETVLLLDDYHVIQHEAIHAGMGFLLEQVPGNHRFVRSARDQSRRCRSRGARAWGSQRDRSRAAGFSKPKAEYLLNEVHQLGLAGETVSRVSSADRGLGCWAVSGGAVAAGSRDADELIVGFSGGDRQIVDYLAGEGARREPDAASRFLLCTSVLQRFCAPLCEAVTGAGGARGDA